ncbi:hypothetical protein ACP70R_041476 [Stipagrostis hirtigluma subsp. patula]
MHIGTAALAPAPRSAPPHPPRSSPSSPPRPRSAPAPRPRSVSVLLPAFAPKPPPRRRSMLPPHPLPPRGRRGHGVERRQRKRLGGRPSLGDGGGGSGTCCGGVVVRRRLACGVDGERGADVPQHGSVARVRVRQRVSRLDRHAQQVLTLLATRFHAVFTSHGVFSLHKSTNRQRREATASSSPSVGLLLQIKFIQKTAGCLW